MARKRIKLWVLSLTMAMSAFIGFAIGRFGHIKWGYLNTLHHWIPALAIMVAAPIFLRRYWWWKLALAFGIGFFISDLKDFTQLRFISPDTNAEYVFWNID